MTMQTAALALEAYLGRDERSPTSPIAPEFDRDNQQAI